VAETRVSVDEMVTTVLPMLVTVGEPQVPKVLVVFA
jgi:hypothetical protein